MILIKKVVIITDKVMTILCNIDVKMYFNKYKELSKWQVVSTK